MSAFFGQGKSWEGGPFRGAPAPKGRGGDRITDLHLWQVGPRPFAAGGSFFSLVSEGRPLAPATYKGFRLLARPEKA